MDNFGIKYKLKGIIQTSCYYNNDGRYILKKLNLGTDPSMT